jgi:hypothetical protein
MLGICLILFIIPAKILPWQVLGGPKLYYNVDSALYYIIFFCLGYVVFPEINKLLLFKSKLDKIVLYSTGGITFLYTMFYFFSKDFFIKLEFIIFLSVIIPIFRALMIIWFFIVLSYICRNINILAIIGKNTLYLCGNEMIIKLIVPSILSMVGLQVRLATPVVTFIYTAFLLYLANKFIVPVERNIFIMINNGLQEIKKPTSMVDNKTTNALPPYIGVGCTKQQSG